ncbi:MAG: hypothetical protein EPO19_09990 [Betaproteobacteria bacterium]|nr:MAG: hypothetical protein EPO19_09990 [Betaproteobacteria bacterium]
MPARPAPKRTSHRCAAITSRQHGSTAPSAGSERTRQHVRPAALRKLVYEAHEVFSDTAPPAKRARQFAMESRVLRTATPVIANSLPTAERLRELYGEREIEVLPNGVDWPEHLP